LFDWVLEQLDLNISISFSEDYIEPKEIINDYRDATKPSQIVEEQKQYEQVFSDRLDFHNNLSIIDLLFSKGPQAKDYL